MAASNASSPATTPVTAPAAASLPDYYYEFFPALGFVIYFMYGVSLFALGLRGVVVSVYKDASSQTQPFKCLFDAAHTHVWCVVDAMNLLLVALLCADQLISVLWNKTHADISRHYFGNSSVFALGLLSALTLIPAFYHPWHSLQNATALVSPYCYFNEVYGSAFYLESLRLRVWVPLAGFAILILTAFGILLHQIHQNWQFKWSDNNGESTMFFLLTLSRCVFLEANVLVPYLLYHYDNSKPFVHQILHISADNFSTTREIYIRITAATIIGVAQPLANVFLVPRFHGHIVAFFNASEVRRTWQSVEDPPQAHSVAGSKPDFGSWFSTTGNIIGEAGVPSQLNADEQRSVSFFYDRNPNL